MAGFLRLLVGIALIPACFAFALTFADSLPTVAGGGLFNIETMSLLGGIVGFTVVWVVLPHPVKTYVVGHELTHALWGLLFFARPSNLKVGDNGGSVRLSKTNMLITLAPYFFPFYTFAVCLLALIVGFFVKPLPWLPLWLFLIGFTWAFHVLFTIDTLSERQPDVTTYGRMFSWTFIFLANFLLIMLWLVAATPLTLSQLAGSLTAQLVLAYKTVWGWMVSLVTLVRGACG